MPDVVPLGTWAIAGVAVLLALGVAGAVTGAWETLLLWIHRVPFSPTQTVVDPIFGRDISFFLFELPFFRLVQSLVNGLLLASLLVAGARYLLATTRGGEVFVTRVRVHLAVLGGLYLLSVAFGYQLDKYELVYSQAGRGDGRRVRRRERAVPGLRRADVPVGARGRPADRRRLHPLDVAAGGDPRSSGSRRRSCSAACTPRRSSASASTPTPTRRKQPYIANNISMTRLAFGLDQWQSRSYGGAAPLTEEAIQSEEDTFTNARLWDYRPLQTTLDQLQAVRQYYDFHDVDTDRYMIDGTLRQVMLSGRELAIDKDPDAPNWVNQRVIKTHGIGVAMVAGQRGHPGGPAEAVDPRPAADLEQRGARDHAAADLLRRERQPLRRRARHAARVRLSRATRTRAASTRRRRGPGRPASRSTRPCPGCCSRSGSATSTC